MKNQEIAKKLQAIIEKMNENIVGAWNNELDGTTDAVILSTFNEGDENEIVYNGWSEELIELMESLKK